MELMEHTGILCVNVCMKTMEELNANRVAKGINSPRPHTTGPRFAMLIPLRRDLKHTGPYHGGSEERSLPLKINNSAFLNVVYQ